MERKQIVKQTRRLGRRRIVFASVMAVVLVFTMMLLMDQKQTTQVNASETKEQLLAMQDDLERMSEVLHISKDAVEGATGEYSGGEFYFSADESSLSQAEQDISVTRDEITEIIRQIDEGDTTNLTEKYESIENHFSTLEGDFTSSVGEIEKIITELSKEEKSSNNTSISELKDVKESLSTFSEELKTSDGDLAKLYGSGNQEVKASVENVSKSVGDVSKSVSDVSKSVGDVSSSVSEVSKDVSAVSNQLTQSTETILKETITAFSDNKDAINQNTDARAKEVKDGLQGDEDVTLTSLYKAVQKVFTYVSDGKRTLATTLLTNGFTVAKEDGTELSYEIDENGNKVPGDDAAYFSLDEYSASIQEGLDSIYAKIAEKTGVAEDDPSIEKLFEDGGGIDSVYQKGNNDGYTSGLDYGKKLGKNIKLTCINYAGLPVNQVDKLDDGSVPDEFYTTYGHAVYRIDNNQGKDIVMIINDRSASVYLYKKGPNVEDFNLGIEKANAWLLKIPDKGYIYVWTSSPVCIGNTAFAIIG